MGSWNSGGWGWSYNSREINKRIHIDRKKCRGRIESWLTPQLRCQMTRQQHQTPENLKGQREAKGRTPPKPSSGLSHVQILAYHVYMDAYEWGAQKCLEEGEGEQRKWKVYWGEKDTKRGRRWGGESIKTNFAWKCCDETQCGIS